MKCVCVGGGSLLKYEINISRILKPFDKSEKHLITHNKDVLNNKRKSVKIKHDKAIKLDYRHVVCV